MHGLAFNAKEGLPFAQDLSLENSVDSYLCFRLTLLHSVSYVFFLYWSFSVTLWTGFYSVLFNMDVVLTIKPSAIVFVDYNIHCEDWLTHPSGTDKPGELCYNFKSPFSDGTFPWEIVKFWLSYCLSFHWLFIKHKTGCPISLYSLWIFSCWLGQSLWWFERCSTERYL